jgi:5-oxoprolinase (ATP-hydrolysing)
MAASFQPLAWPVDKTGSVGVNRVYRRDGRVEELTHIAQAEMNEGDVFEIQTPGGGGYGPSSRAS